MWQQLSILAFLANFVASFIGVYEAEVGATLKISLGPNVVTWKRIRRGGVEEFIKHCEEGESESRCSQFVTTDGEAALPKSNNAVVLANGTLIIESFLETDAGTYSSPDLKPKEFRHSDGSVAMLHLPVIHVQVKE